MKRAAFTLVELSIVLVILGLLVGGVLSGQSLIRAAELRSVTTQLQSYTTAVNAFRDKYFGIPGDLTNATAFWGVAAASGCRDTASVGTETCNGNGDGIINYTGDTNEFFRFWQHLANAGLIEGKFNGITGGAFPNIATEQNVPKGKLNDSFWFAYNYGNWDNSVSSLGAGVIFDGQYNNSLILGGSSTTYDPNRPIFTPAELWNIDKKMDDGLPARGSTVMRAPSYAVCTTGGNGTALNAEYRLDTTDKACAVIFRNLF